MSRTNAHKFLASTDQYNKIASGTVRHIVVEVTKMPYYSKDDIVTVVCLNSKGQEEEFSPKIVCYVKHSIGISYTHTGLMNKVELDKYYIVDIGVGRNIESGEDY